MPLCLRYAAGSHVGLIRDGNEDAGYAGPSLLAVADGMGGHVAGEVASGIAIATAAEHERPVGSAKEENELDTQAAHQQAHEQLETIVGQSNERIRQRVNADQHLRGMGCTLTVLLRTSDGTQLGLAHVGDSRCYRLRQGQLEQITIDHTFVQALVDEGRITASQAAVHPQRSLITRALDGREDVEPDISFHPLRKGDRYLLCSDGLSGVVSADSLQEVLVNEPEPSEACEELIARALEGGGPDNITCIVADVVASRARKSAPVWVGAGQATRQQQENLAPTQEIHPLPAGSGHDTQEMPAVESPPSSQRRGFGQGYRHLVGQLRTVHNPGAIVGDDHPSTPVSPPPAGPVGAVPSATHALAMPTDVPPVTSLRSRFVHREQDSTWPWWVLGIAFVCALVFLLASLAYADSQRRFYVGAFTVSSPAQAGSTTGATQEQVVAIYQGVNREVPVMSLSRLNDTTNLALNSLPPATRERVRSTIPASNAAEAQKIIDDLRKMAQLCQPWADQSISTPQPNNTATSLPSEQPSTSTPSPSSTTIAARPPECAGMGSDT